MGLVLLLLWLVIPVKAQAPLAGGVGGSALAPLPEQEKSIRLSVKTNLLLDWLLVPNVHTEVQIKDNWSAALSYMHAWWSRDSHRFYHRFYGGDLGVHFRFPHPNQALHPLTGHFIGAYVGFFSYDFEWGGKGHQGRFNPYVGINYGYTQSIGDNWAIEWAIGLGYTGGKYYRYRPEKECYRWEATERYRYWGPLKAEISVVKNFSIPLKKKGGARL